MSLIFNDVNENRPSFIELDVAYLAIKEDLKNTLDLINRYISTNLVYKISDCYIKVLLTQPTNNGRITENTKIILVRTDFDDVEDIDDEIDYDDDLDISQEFLQKSILGTQSQNQRRSQLKFKPVPTLNLDESYSVYVKPSSLANLEMFNGDWAIAQCPSKSSQRLVRVYISDDQNQCNNTESTIKASNELLYNLNSGSKDDCDEVIISSLDEQPIIPTANAITVARISSPYSSDKAYQDRFYKALQDHFLMSTQLYRRGDVFSVTISDEYVDKPRNNEENDEQYMFPLKCMRKEASVYFKITNLTSSESHTSRVNSGDLGAFIVPNETEIMQLGVQQSFIPRYPFTNFSLLATKQLYELFKSSINSHFMGLELQMTAMIFGPRGCGKETTLNEVSKLLGIHLLKINCFDIVDENNDAHTEGSLQARFEKAVSCSPCILYFKNLDALVKKSSEERKDTRIINSFKECLNYLRKMSYKVGFPALVVASCTDSELLPNGMLGCFKHEINFEALDKNERFNIISTLLSNFNLSNDISINDLADHTASLFASDISNVVDRAHINAMERVLELSNGKFDLSDVLNAGITLTNADFDVSLKTSRANYSSNIGAPSIPNVKWDDIGGLANVKEEILDTIQLPLDRPDLFADGLKKRSGVLLFGPPGTGKTLLAKAVATECSLNFFSVKGPELLNMYIGESEANVRRIFQKARDAKPCVIFFDELDSVAPKRGNQGDSGGVMDRIVSQILAELDGMSSTNSQVFVIGATNRPDLLDSALLRPGRFDRMIYLGLPNTHESQANILEALTRKFKLEPQLHLLNDVARNLTFDLTGADLYALCSDAMLKCMNRKVSEIESKIASLNNLNDDEFANVIGKHHPKPLSPQYYLDVIAEDIESDVIVMKSDFDNALKELTSSVSASELEHYRQAQLKFTKTGKEEQKVEKEINSASKKSKGKRRAN